MDLVTLSLFICAVIVLTVTPGPDLFLIIGRGISQGRTAALFTALGFFLAGFVQVPLLAFGLASVVAENPGSVRDTALWRRRLSDLAGFQDDPPHRAD
jgi:threonine/homoserine/homoserine lactone efflux protein